VALVWQLVVNVLAVNPGSSGLKLAVIDSDDEILAGEEQATEGDIDADALGRFVNAAPAIDAAAVRLVHGGNVVRAPVVVDATLRAQLQGLTSLAPLHAPAGLQAIDLVAERLPDTPIVVCVDTAFHATIPDAAATYAIPWAWTTEHGVRKYGFHGLSHRYASRRAAELLGRPVESLRLVTCHLGAGASLAAISGGMSVDTTMGFTPLDGLVMATRAGSVDPGVVTWIQRNLMLSAADVEHELERESGLLGISGRTGDLREVLAAADSGDSRSQLAIDVMLHRLVTSIGAMAAAVGGIDALVFTGGIGERSPRVRRAAATRLAFLGIALGEENETASETDVDISAADAHVATLVIHAREDLELAREARALLSSR
jgi:acetate kinase